MFTAAKIVTFLIAGIFGDHMVFQQGAPVRVWGWDRPGQLVKVAMNGQRGQVLAGPDGRWKVELGAMSAGGPYELEVQGSGSASFKDVMVGELWVASGQSNMDFELGDSDDGLEPMPKADEPMVRLFKVQKNEALGPQAGVLGAWSVCNEASAEHFSAVAYFAARRMQKQLGVAVGVIQASWPGSLIQSWTPEPLLRAQPDLLVADDRANGLIKQWDAAPDKAPATLGAPYELVFQDVKVGGVALPSGSTVFSSWSWNGGAESSNGVYHAWGMAPGGEAPSMNLIFSLDDAGNDETVEFRARGTGPFSVAGPMDVGQEHDPNHAHWPFWTNDDLFGINLALGRTWPAFRQANPSTLQQMSFRYELPQTPKAPGGLYNGMIAPIALLPVKGVIWYQGEFNVTTGDGKYARFLELMIQAWRSAWASPIKFVVVQLPNFSAKVDQPEESTWARVREAQLQISQKVPDVALAVTIDTGDGDLHPKNKRPVGERAALAALGRFYGMPVVSGGPLFRSLKAGDGRLWLQFDPHGPGLKILQGDRLKGFAVADGSRRFKWAEAKIVGKYAVELTQASIKKPCYVRYDWAQNPDGNLGNEAGLPASPFRNDGPKSY